MSDIRVICDRSDIVAIADAIREKNGSTDGYRLGEMAGAIEEIPVADNSLIDSIINRSVTEISNDVKTIGSYAFYYCENLANINFPSATKIANYAFAGCSMLTNIYIPLVTDISTHVFYRCSRLTSVDFPLITKISNYSFYECKKLTNINFPLAISVGDSVFYRCGELTNVDFPLVTTIGSEAFYYCDSLTDTNFPLVTSIKGSAFRYCSSLTNINFPSVTSIGTSTFMNCSNLISIILGNNAVTTLSATNAFSSTPIASGTGYIYVPRSLVDSYKSATNWSTYADQIRAIEDYPEITGG